MPLIRVAVLSVLQSLSAHKSSDTFDISKTLRAQRRITMVEQNDVIAVLELIRPSLQADGGDVKFVSVDEDGVVTVELQGACKGCPMSQMTLANGVERILKERVPGVTRVVPADM